MQLPPRAIERVVAAETVVNQDLCGETVREDAGQRCVGAQLVRRGLIALILSAQAEIDVTTPLGWKL